MRVQVFDGDGLAFEVRGKNALVIARSYLNKNGYEYCMIKLCEHQYLIVLIEEQRYI